MTAATEKDAIAERGWRRDEFEALSEDEVVDLLLRRMRRLLARGIEPAEALVIASRVELPLA